jgi:hypothetical protein
MLLPKQALLDGQNAAVFLRGLAQFEAALQRVGVFWSQDTLTNGQNGVMLYLGFVVVTLFKKRNGQMVAAGQRLGMFRSQGALIVVHDGAKRSFVFGVLALGSQCQGRSASAVKLVRIARHICV